MTTNTTTEPFDLLALITAPPAAETVAPVPAPPAKRTAHSCKRCGEWFYSDQYRISAPCPICGGKMEWRGTVGADGRARHDEERMACDDRCQGARGRACDCHCGGRNHGIWRTVTVTVVDGKPTLSLDHPDRLAGLAAKRLPDIELAESMTTDLVDRLEVIYRTELADRRAGKWLQPAAFSRLCDWSGYRKAIRHAGTLKVPANRVRSLGRIRDEIAGLER